MTTENTEEVAVSSPPAFMMQKPEADAPEATDTEKAKAKAERQAAREAAAQDKDAFDIRTGSMDKATFRLLEQAEYLERIAGVTDKTLPGFIGLHPLGQVLDKIVAFEDAVELVETRLKTLKAQVSFVREVALPTRLDDEESQTFTSKDTGHRMSRTARVLASIKSGFTEQAFKWLRENNLGPLIKETCNSSSLNAAAKELLANGKELPDDIFNVHTKDGVSITRKKAK